MRHLVVMLAKQIFAEIISQIPPDSMNVVGFVLSVVVFHQKGWTLNPVIMTLTRSEIPRPREMNCFATCLNGFQISFSDFRAITKNIFLEQGKKQFPLRFSQIQGGNSHRLKRFGFAVVARNNVPRG